MAENIIFAYLASSGKSVKEACILTKSIRDFAGKYSNNSIWVLVPDNGKGIPETTKDELQSLNARLIPFQVHRSIWGFPFATKVYASAVAEEMTEDQADLLLWMDTHAMVINDPHEIILTPEKSLGYRPVDHTLIGSRYSEPIDAFWELIYRECDVREEKLFAMTSSVEDFEIRPYFNAGFVVTKPDKGLFRLWRDNFNRLFKEKKLEDFYQQDIRYKIFMHQAVMTGTILANFKKAEMKELPYRVNYPLHMHRDYPVERRPKCLNDLTTVRYENFFDNTNWESIIPVKEPLGTWLEEQLF